MRKNVKTPSYSFGHFRGYSLPNSNQPLNEVAKNTTVR